MILISALFVSIGGCIYAFLRQRQTQENMNIMLKELETLQQAEGNLLAVTEKYIFLLKKTNDFLFVLFFKNANKRKRK